MENNVVFGTCPDMCPASEIRERERAGLIHVFEKLDTGSRDAPQPAAGRGRGRARAPASRKAMDIVKADKEKAVKEYTRPAAGVNKNIAADLRPPHVLKKTVAYLCIKVLTRADRPFIDVYDFVFDRLRAVRQDMVIQRINDESAIIIMETIIKFHLYAEYKFRYNPPRSYDPCINQKHLRDCLKTLLSLYGYNAYRGPTRPYFEALYCISSPESYEVMSRAFEIRSEMKNAEVFEDAFEFCMAIQQRNFYKFFQILNELPPLLAAFAVQHVPFIRTYSLKALTAAYGVQSCKIPVEWIEEVLCYPNYIRTEKDMIRIGSEIIQNEEKGDKFVKLSKSSPFLKESNGIMVESDVKFTVLSGLNNVDIVSTEQLCPWGGEYL